MGTAEDSSRSKISGDSPLSIIKDELKESEEKLKIIFNILPLGISVLDSERKIVYMNTALGKILGMTEKGLSEGLYKNRVYIRADGTPMPSEEFASVRAVKEKKEIIDVETGVKKEDGSIIWTNVSAIPIKFSDWGVVIVTSDITNRKKVEEQINSLAKFPEENPSPVMRVSKEGILLYSNKAGMELIALLKGKIGSKVPEKILELVNNNNNNRFELNLNERIFSFELIQIKDKNYTNLYGRDITDRKKAEQMLKENEQKLRDSLAMSARQNIQMSRMLKEKTQMQEKLHEYAKQLETRVETLEKEKIPLTSKEKLVFYGLCAYPSLNDLELSEKLKLKRSTITAIRNRLRKDSWFSPTNIPNFYALGCESVSVMHCNFNTSLKERRDLGLADEISKMPEIIFSNESDDDSVCIFASKKFVDLQKFLSSSLLMKKDILKGDLKHFSFFFELNLVNQFNFARLLGKLFELKVKDVPISKLTNPKSVADLNHNEKRVLLASIQYPELSIAELSRKIWLSKPTISKIKSELLENNFFYPLIIPELRKLSLGLAAMMSLKFDQKFMKKVHMLESEIEKSDFHSVCRIVGDKEITSLMFFKNREEFEKELIKITDFYRKNDIPFAYEQFIVPVNKRLHFEKLDMAAITKKLLFPDV
jgi:PAS domain S-box-containing protein